MIRNSVIGHDHQQPLLRALHVLVLPGPDDGVAGGQLDLLGDLAAARART